MKNFSMFISLMAIFVSVRDGKSSERDFPSDTDSPNIILIYCDNLGYGDIEPFGAEVNRTPNLNRMAREGRRFTHFCVTAGVCTPSRASLMTGCYAQRVGMDYNPRDGNVLRPVSPYGLNPNEITIADVLRKQDYATKIIGKWHLGDQPEFLPTRQGFDSFFGLPYSDDMTEATGKRIGDRLGGAQWPPLPLMEDESIIEAPANRNLLTQRETERALEFIEQQQDHPFFLYLPHNMPGSTTEPFAGPRFQGRSANGPWGDVIEELDWSLGQILDKLEHLGLEGQTLVIWTSDNGAPLASGVNPDSPHYSPRRGSNLPLHGEGYTTAEGSFRVPTIMWWPGKIPAGTICNELCTTMDILPTLANLAGTEPPKDRIIDGHDIRPLMFARSGAESPYEVFYYYQGKQLQAVRSGRWKLFLPVDNFSRHPHFGSEEEAEPLLFDVVNDISSSLNVADQHPEVVQRLMDFAEDAREDLGDKGIIGKNERPHGHLDNPGPLR
ncbi:MAG: sulfatase [Bacteroidales bacterium]|nr:sulfatase [Bacteroidales bacterium]